MTTIFVGASYERRVVAQRVMRALQREGHMISFDWTHLDPEAADTKRLQHEGFVSADCMVMLVPAGRSTHVQLGMAISRGIPVVIYALEPEALRNPKDGRVCTYYDHAAVRITFEENELLQLVKWRTAGGQETLVG